LATDLQNLIAQLSSESSSSSSSAGGSADSSLQTSFNNLVTALGGNTGTASLGNFLQTFASDLSQGAAAGNLVNTQA
jgi:hypothetical protein